MNEILRKLLAAPCVFCNYDGPMYFSDRSHEDACPWFKVAGIDTRAKKLVEVLRTLLRRLK